MSPELVASGEVVVRELEPPGREWSEIVEVFERDLTDTDGSPMTPEDVARRVARNQAPGPVETLEVDIS